MDHSSTPSSQIKEFFIARQPILNRKHNIVAYELLFRTTTESAVVTDDLAATTALISHALDLGLERVIGSELAFINVDEKMIMSDSIKFLPPRRVVLEILETVVVTDALLARLAELAHAGYTFALDDVISLSADQLRMFPFVTIVKIDITTLSPIIIKKIVARVQSHKKKLLAEKVETAAQYKFCCDAGFDLFQGYYFARPAIISGKKMSASHASIIQILNLLDDDDGISQVEQALKRDPALIIALLKMVNTPAAGIGFKITSIRQAIVTLGARQLRRWLQILLFSNTTSAAAATPIMQYACARGKLMELLAHRAQPNNSATADAAFTVGVMSLMPALLEIELTQLLHDIKVDSTFVTALTDHAGFLGQLLRIVECAESPDTELDDLGHDLASLGISLEEFCMMQLSAFEWSSAVGAS